MRKEILRTLIEADGHPNGQELGWSAESLTRVYGTALTKEATSV